MQLEQYLYSWTSYNGYRQTIIDGKVTEVVSIPVEEAKRKYYAESSPEDIANDLRLEEAANYLSIKGEDNAG